MEMDEWKKKKKKEGRKDRKAAGLPKIAKI
jgi:hypothetical protein